MTKEVEMSTKYDPSQVEPGRYKEWIEKGLFKPNEDKEAKPYLARYADSSKENARL